MFPCFHTKLSKNSMVLIAYMHSLVTLLKLQTFHCCPKAKVNLLILFVFFFLNNHFCSFHFADSGTKEGICWREEWRSQAVGAVNWGSWDYCMHIGKKGESATPVLLVSISPFSPMLSETTISCYFSQDGHHEGRSRTSKKAARKNRSGAADCQATIGRCAILWESKKLLGRWNNWFSWLN